MKTSREHFERLALEQLDMVYRVARRLCKNPIEAEDLVQETYLRAFRAADSFELEGYGIRPWLLQILHNLHISRNERERRQPHALDEEQLAGAVDEHPLPPPGPGALFDSMDERLATALQSLPAQYQEVMLLWAVEDFSYKEIAAALKVPIGTVMSRLHRARQ